MRQFGRMKLRWPLRLGLVRLSLLAIVIGVVTGLGAVIFRGLIGVIHNASFLGIFSLDYEANVFTPPSPWGGLIILVRLSADRSSRSSSPI